MLTKIQFMYAKILTNGTNPILIIFFFYRILGSSLRNRHAVEHFVQKHYSNRHVSNISFSLVYTRVLLFF